ncbi:MAG: glycosyltransferase family 4 protein, partial [Sulfurimicrobium sp.]|nr:glycosyltransferase family 4 protein [Sulfurimicrobium sp.]
FAALRRMKIALIRQRYTPFGGAERFVANAVQALQAEGASLTVVTRQWESDGKGESLVCNPPYLGSLWRDWSFARCVCRTLQKHSFDLVQSHERIPCCDIYRAGDGVHREWLKQRRRVLGKIGRLSVAINPYHRYTLAAERKLFHSPSLKAVICNSRMVKEEIRHYFGLAEEKLHVIYSGVNLEAFHPGLKLQHRSTIRAQYKIPEEAVLFLFVGSGFERKGLRTLLQAMAQIPPASHLMVVGKDKHLAHYQRQAENLGLAGRVHFAHGQKDPKPFYGAADAFVLPTLYDPFPNTALEAFACGLPVVTSTKSGAAELVREGENGFVCDALDQNALASAMVKLTDQATRLRLGTAARETVTPLSPENMARRLLGLYRDLSPQNIR